ncbi:hypothetical protein [Paraburkholderia sp. BCC1885]|uniref:hypothetical protein n=1 Tax=Paraburkholderia sp. BCC1885 TaxID=2562669 RepID=UPI001183B9AC|nr:hypothetical protein [Paraburkholderia sp. BCC1885]
MLLPLPPASVCNRSLRFHSSLTAMQMGFGAPEHLVHLANLMYIVWFLQRAGYGSLELSDYHTAEQQAEKADLRGMETRRWMLDDEGYPPFERILSLHDQQIGAAPAHAIISAENELARFLASDSPSLLPDSALKPGAPTLEQDTGQCTA